MLERKDVLFSVHSDVLLHVHNYLFLFTFYLHCIIYLLHNFVMLSTV